jgi:hypothetical protein
MKKILLYIVILLLVEGCKYFEEKRLFSKKVDTLINYAEGIDDSADTVIQDTVTGLDTDIMESQITSESSEDIYNPEYYHSDYKYHVIVGSFLIPEYAERYAEKLEAMGYKPEIILRDDGYHMVSAHASNELTACNAGLSSIKAEITQGAWIYEMK